jgi:2-polyprenyl-3-methyl-5-hydroxy-6-metoxy-1,4-benzoquinol methylase
MKNYIGMTENNCAWDNSWENEGVQVIDCNTCGFKHQFPWPDPYESSVFYEKEYYEKLKTNYLDDVKNEKNNREMWALDNFKLFNSFLNLNNSESQPSILDVGCSFGSFLNYFKQNNWNCIGVEPSKYAANFAKDEFNLVVHEGLLENFSIETLGGPFDVIHIKEALDHLVDPEGFIKRCSTELLKPNGILCIETANQFSEMQMAVVESTKCPMWWIVPDHVGYFDRSSLTTLVNKYNFKVIHEASTFPMEIFPLMGEDFISTPEVGKICHNRRLYFEDSLHENGLDNVRRHLYQTLASGGFGRGLIQLSQLKATKV